MRVERETGVSAAVRSRGLRETGVSVEASNTASHEHFGTSVALSDDGQTLAVGAESEDEGAGAVYLF